MGPPLTIALLHPELGFGGSERLMLDAAHELTARGHRVSLFTARHDPARAFDDSSATHLDIRVRASHLPYDVAGHARVPCAIVRMAALANAARRELRSVDAVLCDLVPHAVPVIRARAQAPVVFYCHYPDILLATAESTAYSLYRRAIKALERRGLRHSARVITNSRFTLAALTREFPDLGGVPTEVIAPGVGVERFRDVPPLRDDWPAAPEILVVALGRFHRDKNHALAIAALAALRSRLPADVSLRLRLVIAGGADMLPETRGLIEELAAVVEAAGVTSQVSFILSPTDAQQLDLLSRAAIVVHTAPAEHFGIVPVEAMAAARPVIAVGHAGPAETILDGTTGLLCTATADAFADALVRLITDGALAARMGRRARERAVERFSRAAFGERIEAAIRASTRPQPAA